MNLDGFRQLLPKLMSEDNQARTKAEVGLIQSIELARVD